MNHEGSKAVVVGGGWLLVPATTHHPLPTKEMFVRVKVILNPAANSGRGRDYAGRIETAGQRWDHLDVQLTERPGQAGEIAREAAETYDVVAAAGGDGTVHEVVNGLVGRENAKASLGVIPLGSGNDFAYALDILGDVETAVQRLFNGKPRFIDLAMVEDDRGRHEVFVNNFGVGFDANVVIRAAAIGRVHGFAMYFLAVLQAILYDFQPCTLDLRFDEESVREEAMFLSLGLGQRHGGGFFLTPDASQYDNLIDSCIVKPLSRPRAFYLLGKAMQGTHVSSSFVTMRQNRHIIIRSERPMPIHIDGEVFAYPEDGVRQVSVSSLPNALQVMV